MDSVHVKFNVLLMVLRIQIIVWFNIRYDGIEFNDDNGLVCLFVKVILLEFCSLLVQPFRIEHTMKPNWQQKILNEF